MKKLLAVCSFSVLVAGCAHQGAGYGSGGGFGPIYGADCLMDSAYSLGPSSYALGPSYGYGALDEGLCRNGGRRIYPYTSPESTNAIAQRASVVGPTRHRPDPRVITRPETGADSGGPSASSASSSIGQGSGSGVASIGTHAPAAPAAPAAAAPSPALSSPPASQPAPH